MTTRSHILTVRPSDDPDAGDITFDIFCPYNPYERDKPCTIYKACGCVLPNPDDPWADVPNQCPNAEPFVMDGTHTGCEPGTGRLTTATTGCFVRTWIDIADSVYALVPEPGTYRIDWDYNDGDEILTLTVTETLPNLDLPYLIGVNAGDGELHAITCDAALYAYAATPPGEVVDVGTECARTAHHATDWGGFIRGNPKLTNGVCPHCAWAAALGQATQPAHDTQAALFSLPVLTAELATVTPSALEAAAMRRLGVDPLLLRRVCEAILAASVAEHADHEPDHPAWVELLAHATRHRPVLLFAGEECLTGHCDEHSSDEACYAAATTVACRGCTVWAGTWAGEWAGYSVLTVPAAACPVLPAMATAYTPEATRA